MAERLGRTVEELEDTMSYREFYEWAVYDQIRAADREHKRINARIAK